MTAPDTPAKAQEAAAGADAPSQGLVSRWLAGFYAWRAAVKLHPLWGTLFAAVVLLIGVVATIALDNAKRWYFGPDEFLVQMAESQKQEFSELKASLDGLRGSVTGEGRKAFRTVQRAVASLESGNAQLVQQLQLAKHENDRLRLVAEKSGRVSGGYDFLLSEHSGMRLDAHNVLGLSSVSGSWVTVNLSSASAEPVKEDLRSGESIPFRNAKGRPCRVSLLAIENVDVGTASFALACA